MDLPTASEDCFIENSRFCTIFGVDTELISSGRWMNDRRALTVLCVNDTPTSLKHVLISRILPN